ncbi:hypothetical protein MCOR02_009654 [Pyricularia oryzae]|uniref:ADF-H domain-containing protein n=1 Tax=Pyricularia oryzae TaxID=318829 RepID=A0A4P7NAH5_PYROR|nr:hypothetical protein MCOR02_009654 [Pyricularia oryzae]KAI6289703.1 hypothetical protein MCOR34_010673 [Pyricularia oryzae]KAI6457573.1 hypothetical protein MCOR17_007795 [Pyricularia oryzae]QBZ59573.1 hypothetical protein PoMZ_04534 [Pyricularia oryzae]
MSLNGLDTPEIKEAHDTAVAEPGGWFVLKYAGRDVLELLGRGNGGIVEIRNAIAQYEDPSPLYGFLRYRRRNVIIKYLPEDCSRLVQARVTVHLDSICERFSPYDTIFEIAEAKELKDTKLSAACSLHTASGSTSSSTSSLRRRRLMEIAEEEEEQRASKRQSVVNEEGENRPKSIEIPPVALDSGLASSPEESQFSGKIEPPPFVGSQSDRPPSPTKSLETYGQLDSYGSGSPYSYKPKVKLGPRPSLDMNARQRNGTLSGFRPISALPAGFKMQKKEKPAMVRQSMDENSHPIVQELFGSGARDPQNTVPTRPHTSGGIQPPPIPESKIFVKPPLTPGAVSLASAKSSMYPNTSSPEKSRLKKAMQLREKKKQKALLVAADAKVAETVEDPDVKVSSLDSDAIGQTSLAENPEPVVADSIAEEAVEEQPVQEQPPVDSPQPADKEPETEQPSVTEQTRDTTPETDAEPIESVDQSPDQQQENEVAIIVDDGEQGSAVENHVPVTTAAAELDDDNLSSLAREGTVSDAHTDSSHPASPLVGSSDLGNSTKASSVSEATDETVLDQSQTKTAETAGNNQTGSDQAEPDVLVGAVDVSCNPSAEISEESKREDEVAAAESQDQVANRQELEEPAPVQLPISKFASAVVNPNRSSTVAGVVTEATIGSDRNSAVEHIPSQTESTSPRLGIPQSKFSTAKQQPASPSGRSPDTPTIAIDDLGEKENEKENQDPEKLASGLAVEKPTQKRKVSIDPIRIDTANLSDDEDLMDELQTATLQEARPMNISKSPITPVFPTQPLAAPAAANTGESSPRPITSQGIPSSLVTDSPAGSAGPAIRPMTAAMDSPSGSGTNTPQGYHGLRSASNPTARAPLSLLSATGDGDRPFGMRATSSGSAFLNRLGSSSGTAPPSPSPSVASTSAANLLGKKAGVGSSISQRIKALEKISAAGLPSPNATERPQSAFFAVRQQQSIGRGGEVSRAPSVVERATSLGQDQTPSPPRSRGRDITTAAGSIRDRSGSISSRLSVFEGGNLPRGRPDSVQVTARIVRDPRPQFPRVTEPRADTSEGSMVDLKPSVLVVDHEKGSDEPQDFVVAPVETPRKETILQRRQSKKEKRRSQSEDVGIIGGDGAGDEIGEDGTPRRRSSLSIVKDFIKDRRRSVLSGGKSPSTDNLHSAVLGPSPLTSPNASRSPSRPPSVHQSTSISGRLSISSRRSSTSKDRDLPPVAVMSPTNGPEASLSGDESVKATEKKSRASRFIRRLSNSLSSSRKTVTPVMSPTVTEEEYDGDDHGSFFAPGRQPQHQQPTQLAYMGDVNVQFPDNLLWKRRTMCLDSQGFLILSAVQGIAAATAANTTALNGIKRYHLSDFRVPYAPEMEQQELPNSVCLDFIEGSSLQIACEDRAGQLTTLHALQDAHRNHTTFGQ